MVTLPQAEDGGLPPSPLLFPVQPGEVSEPQKHWPAETPPQGLCKETMLSQGTSPRVSPAVLPHSPLLQPAAAELRLNGDPLPSRLWSLGAGVPGSAPFYSCAHSLIYSLNVM